jgi:hypothetical protein
MKEDRLAVPGSDDGELRLAGREEPPALAVLGERMFAASVREGVCQDVGADPGDDDRSWEELVLARPYARFRSAHDGSRRVVPDNGRGHTRRLAAFNTHVMVWAMNLLRALLIGATTPAISRASQQKARFVTTRRRLRRAGTGPGPMPLGVIPYGAPTEFRFESIWAWRPNSEAVWAACSAATIERSESKRNKGAGGTFHG